MLIDSILCAGSVPGPAGMLSILLMASKILASNAISGKPLFEGPTGF
jgi:hypothetical protein